MLTCQVCGKELIKKQKRFCSHECRNASMKITTEVQCLNCGRLFTKTPWELKRGGKYCSSECYHEAQIGVSRLDMRKREQHACVVCGTMFETGGQAGDINKKFCSRECRDKARYRQGKPCKTLKPEDAAYLAGLIDGEGSIMVIRHRETVSTRVVIANTNRQVLDWVRELVEVGSIVTKLSSNPLHKTGYMFQCNSKAAETLVQQIRPYLHIKVQQADLLLETAKKLRDPALKADRSWQYAVADQVSALNKRGPSAS